MKSNWFTLAGNNVDMANVIELEMVASNMD